jgi:hypothetical protein
LQEALDTVDDGGTGRAGQVPADRLGTAQRTGQRDVRGGAFRMGGDVLPRHLLDQAKLDAEEGADPVEHLGGRVEQLGVAEEQDLLPGEQAVQVLELLAIPAEPDVVPERRPAGRHPAVFLRASAEEVADRLPPGRPQVRPVGVCALNRITQDHDEPGVRDEIADPPLCREVV